MLASALLLLPAPLHAQITGQGVERVLVDDGASQICVDARSDHVSVRLGRIVVEKSESWFSEDTAVDIVIDGKIEKRDASYNRNTAQMPVVFRADISEYDEGTIVTPIEIVLISKFPLTLSDQITNLFQIDFSFVNSAKPSTLSRVISRLPDAARGLPIPPSPYTQAFVNATSVLGGIVEAMLQDDDNKDDVARQGRISLEFNETGRCGRNGAFSGTYAFIKSYSRESGKGIISLNDIGKYCFIKFRDSSAVYFENRSSDGQCTYEKASAVRLLNPHFTLIVGITNDGGKLAQDRDVLESGMALVRQASAAPADQPKVVASVDDLSLSRTFGDLSRQLEFAELGDSGLEIDGGSITFMPNDKFVKVSDYNAQRLEYRDLNDPDKWPHRSDAPALNSGKITGNEINLNTLVRCSIYGLDVYECF